MPCAKIGWNSSCGSGEKDFQILLTIFRYFVTFSLRKEQGPLFEQTWIPFTQGCFEPSLVEISSVILAKKILKISFKHFNYFAIISPKNALWHVWLKLTQWFIRRIFLNNVHVFSLFRYYLPLKKGGVLHLNKIETPLPNDALC